MLLTHLILTPLSCSLELNSLGEQTGAALGKALETNTSLKELK